MPMHRNTPPVTHHLDNRIVKLHSLKAVDHKRMRSSNSTHEGNDKQSFKDRRLHWPDITAAR
jgi:hypothetical protein